METSFLIKGNEICGVGRAEHVTAVAAVVPTQEEAEGGAAGGRVAARRGRVRLAMESAIRSQTEP